MSFLEYFRIGKGTLKPKLRAALELEGIVLLEEGLPGKVRYKHFKAPGRRFHGKVTLERIGLAITHERFAVYCRSGRAKLIDVPFSDPRLARLDISLKDEHIVAIHIDFDRFDVPKVSGEMTIEARSPRARAIVDELHARLRR